MLERQPQIRDIPKAGGLGGQILEMLRYRGELERFVAASTAAEPAAGAFPWGGMHVDLPRLADPPMKALPLPQPMLERVLDERARELGAEIRRGLRVVGLSQDDGSVTAEVRGADVRGADGAAYRVTAQYLVGCDGSRSAVRDLAGIPFPGMTYPEVQRLASFTVPDSVTMLENGDIDVVGLGRIPSASHEPSAVSSRSGRTSPELMGVFTSEEESTDYDDDAPMTVTEVRDSIRRVLGVDLPLGEPTRLTRFTFHARQVERYRDGRILLAGDAAHLFPSPGAALNVALLDSVNLGGSWPPTSRGGRRPGCWTRTTTSAALPRTNDAPHPGAGGDQARSRPGRRRSARALPGAARRRAAAAPPRRAHGRLRRPLPVPRPRCITR